MASETITKNDLKEILNSILPQTAVNEYIGDVGSSIRTSWSAPEDGFIVLHSGAANSSSSTAYWYVKDSDLDIFVACIFYPSANGSHRTASFPVIKGHTYTTSNYTNISVANAYYYKISAK